MNIQFTTDTHARGTTNSVIITFDEGGALIFEDNPENPHYIEYAEEIAKARLDSSVSL